MYSKFLIVTAFVSVPGQENVLRGKGSCPRAGAPLWVTNGEFAQTRPLQVTRTFSKPRGQGRAPLALFDKVVCRDGDLSVKFRIDAGQSGKPQHGNAAGIVWRYQDPNNYYLLTLSADDRNIVLHRVQKGVSEVISTSGGKRAPVGVEEDIRAGQWHVVKVAFRGPKVQVFFGNRSVFTAEDSGILTPGRTGLWAKGAKGAAFDDFE